MAIKYDVIAVGDYCLDLIFTGLQKLPELGVEIVGTGFEMLPGGAYNSVVSMHRLGIHVGWASDFGSDEFCRFVLDWVEKEGLDSRLFSYHNHPLRRVTVAASYPHERAFIAYYDPEPKIPAALSALMNATAKIFYVPGIYYGPSFDIGLKIVRSRRMKIIMDGNSTQDDTLQKPKLEKVIRNLDIFMPNSLEAMRLTGETKPLNALKILGDLCSLVVMKDGANGAYALCQGDLIHDPGLIINPVDTTGAGDCFDAGFIKAWLDGKPINECLRWGNIVGGLSTLAPGISRVITSEDVQQILRRS